MPDRQSDVYEDVFYTNGRKRLTNGEFASICSTKDGKNMYARYALNTKTKEEIFYIKMHGGRLIDPFRPSLSKANRFTYKKVSANNFRKYVRYLQTGSEYLLKEVSRDLDR